MPVLSPSQFYDFMTVILRGICGALGSSRTSSPSCRALLPAGAREWTEERESSRALLLPEAPLEAVLILIGCGQVPRATLPLMSGMARHLGDTDTQIKITH